jgi:hypothetical protein
MDVVGLLLLGEEGAAQVYERLFRLGPEGVERALGMRITHGDGLWELTGFNDLRVPFWSKVVRGRAQKKQYTIAGSERAVEERLRPPTIARPGDGSHPK